MHNYIAFYTSLGTRPSKNRKAGGSGKWNGVKVYMRPACMAFDQHSDVHLLEMLTAREFRSCKYQAGKTDGFYVWFNRKLYKV